MTCPYCQSDRLQKLKRTTDLGYLGRLRKVFFPDKIPLDNFCV